MKNVTRDLKDVYLESLSHPETHGCSPEKPPVYANCSIETTTCFCSGCLDFQLANLQALYISGADLGVAGFVGAIQTGWPPVLKQS